MKLLSTLVKRLSISMVLQLLLFSILAFLAFYKIFSFWFFHGWETSWLGLMAGDFSLISLMRSHGLISYGNYLLFGWRPAGWFITALMFHVATAMIVNRFVARKTTGVLGLVTGLLFLVTTAHHDVVTWGSFESLYAVQTLCFYAGLWFFDTWRGTQRMRWYVCMVGVFIIALIIRESGLLFLPLVLFFDLICWEKLFDRPLSKWRSSLWPVIRRHAFLWVLSGIYLLVRASYGGASHDFIDERVQFRILLFHEHRYLEYFWYGLLSFGYFIGPYLLPYPVLNGIRDVMVRFITTPGFRIYFFTSVGWICYTGYAWWIYTQRKKTWGQYLLFTFAAFTAVTVFYSFAWSVKESFLASAYSWSENRWRYLGFTFFAASVAIVGQRLIAVTNRRHKNLSRGLYVGIGCIAAYLVVNTLFLHHIEDQMYRENSAPAKLFYKTFMEKFPQLSVQDRFYMFKGSPGLGDFFAELSTTASTYYPGFVKTPEDWVRPEMYYILTAMKQNFPWAQNVHFVDFNMNSGVRDHSSAVYRLFSQLNPLYFPLSNGIGENLTAETPGVWPVDFRYRVSFDYQAALGIPPIVQDLRKDEVLTAFSGRLGELMSEADISVCKTMGNPSEPSYDVRKEFVLDGNINRRSFWWADCRPAWITLDMGRNVTFSGALWASTTHVDSIPRDYRYEVSEDGKVWHVSGMYKRNTDQSRIDVFKNPMEGRYIRLWVNETSFRQMLALDEFVPLFPDTVGISEYYGDVVGLYADMYKQVSKVSWVRALWSTDPTNGVSAADRYVYVPIIADGNWRQGVFEIPDSEYYSAQGQFLKRFLKSIELVTPPGISARVDRVIITSPFQP